MSENKPTVAEIVEWTRSPFTRWLLAALENEAATCKNDFFRTASPDVAYTKGYLEGLACVRLIVDKQLTLLKEKTKNE